MKLLPLALCLGPLSTSLQAQSSPDSAAAPSVRTLPPATGGGTPGLLPPVNDDCTAPTPIAGAGPHAFDVTTATTGTQGQANSACLIGTVTGIAFDVWYDWTAAASGDHVLTTCGLTTMDSKIAVYAGAGCPAGAAIACSDDTCSPGTSQQTTLTFNAINGQVYSIQVGVYPGTAVSTGSFTINPISIPCGRIDDGSTENMGGWTAGGEYCWMQSFGTIGQQITLTQVEVAWGSLAFPINTPTNGSPAKVAVWEDPNDDGDPADAVLLDLVSTTVQNVSTDTFNSVALNSPQTVNGIFFIGAGEPHPAGQFVMPMDKGGPGASMHRAWRFGNNTATPVDYAVFTNNLFVPKAIQTISPAFESAVMLRYVCQTSPGVAMCEPGVAGVMACACGNPNGASAGCANTGSSGATLASLGVASLASDATDPGSVTLSGASMLSGSTCIFLQGNALVPAGTTFGAGIRCAGGSLKRLYVKPISGGAQTAPQAADRSISNRSSDLGDVIGAGTMRWYQAYYRDPSLPNPGGACPAIATFNITTGQEIVWGL